MCSLLTLNRYDFDEGVSTTGSEFKDALGSSNGGDGLSELSHIGREEKIFRMHGNSPHIHAVILLYTILLLCYPIVTYSTKHSIVDTCLFCSKIIYHFFLIHRVMYSTKHHLS